MIDFLVVGGGIAGVSAAARLSEHGSVTLLEGEDELAYHTSGRSAALFEQNYGKPSTIELNKASFDFHDSNEILSPRGLMLIGSTATADLFTSDQEQMQLETISIQDAIQMVPILDETVVDRAAFHAAALDIDTDRLMQTFVRMGRANCALFTTKAQVTKIERRTNGWEVWTGSDVYLARNIVNAAGAWVDHIADMAGIMPHGFTPLRRSMARIPAPGGHDVSTWPMVFGPGEDWYAKPDAGALIVSPAEEDLTTPHDAFTDDMVLAEGLARYEANVTEPVTRLLSAWAGLRTFSRDRTQMLGPDPQDDSFIWCAGQGGYGMQSSPAASQLLADLVTGSRSDLPADTIAAFLPARFS